MKRFLISAAVLALSVGITGNAEAKGSSRSGSANYSYHGSRSASQHYRYGHGSPYNTGYHKDYHVPYYQGVHNHFWSSRSWSSRYGCYVYWCPQTYRWFYWCEPFGCYYPIEHCPTGRYAY
jgi:hypothetical protein